MSVLAKSTRRAAAAGIALGLTSSLIGLGATSASAAGCASISKTVNGPGIAKYVTMKNNCGKTISARLDLVAANDTACYSIGAYGTRTITTYGIVRDAVVC